MRHLTRALTLLMLALPAAAQPTTITGTVAGDGGTPLPSADVSIHPAGLPDVLGATATGPDGAFLLSVDTTGLFDLRFDGGGAPAVTTTLFVGSPGDAVGLEAHLAAGTGADAARVAFDDPAGPAARVARFADSLAARGKAFVEGMRALREGGGSGTAFRMRMQRWQQDHFSATDALLTAALAGATTPSERAALLVLYLDRSVRADPSVARRALEALAPEAPLWSAGRYALTTALRASPAHEGASEYARRALEAGAGPLLRPGLLAFLVDDAKKRGDDAEARGWYARLEREHPSSQELAYVRRQYDFGSRIQPGNPVPPFEVDAFDAPGTTYTAQSLLGKTYLVDFWAVWCAPCIAEMPRLHAAYERYRDRGFTILSVSIDDYPADVQAFRSQRYPMPWLHAYIGPFGDSEMTQLFEVEAIPRPVLVGADGRILALEDRLRGPNLDATLAEIFGNAAAGSH